MKEEIKKELEDKERWRKGDLEERIDLFYNLVIGKLKKKGISFPCCDLFCWLTEKIFEEQGYAVNYRYNVDMDTYLPSVSWTVEIIEENNKKYLFDPMIMYAHQAKLKTVLEELDIERKFDGGKEYRVKSSEEIEGVRINFKMLKSAKIERYALHHLRRGFWIVKEVLMNKGLLDDWIDGESLEIKKVDIEYIKHGDRRIVFKVIVDDFSSFVVKWVYRFGEVRPVDKQLQDMMEVYRKIMKLYEKEQVIVPLGGNWIKDVYTEEYLEGLERDELIEKFVKQKKSLSEISQIEAKGLARIWRATQDSSGRGMIFLDHYGRDVLFIKNNNGQYLAKFFDFEFVKKVSFSQMLFHYMKRSRTLFDLYKYPFYQGIFEGLGEEGFIFLKKALNERSNLPKLREFLKQIPREKFTQDLKNKQREVNNKDGGNRKDIFTKSSLSISYQDWFRRIINAQIYDNSELFVTAYIMFFRSLRKRERRKELFFELYNKFSLRMFISRKEKTGCEIANAFILYLKKQCLETIIKGGVILLNIGVIIIFINHYFLSGVLKIVYSALILKCFTDIFKVWAVAKLIREENPYLKKISLNRNSNIREILDAYGIEEDLKSRKDIDNYLIKNYLNNKVNFKEDINTIL
ncbi:MAG TPA: hypothetical protein EYP89_01420, partial [Candidatus Omnitrophica bacterium]|nr:hypothetical protein [Candidatus Omnitrophota bacterium]